MKKGAVMLAVLSLIVSLSILVQADSIQAWGDNAVSQLDAPAGDDFAAIACGENHSLALRTDGSLAAWGDDSYDQLNAPPGTDYVAIAAGGRHNLALRDDGSLTAWGLNDHGQADVPAGNDFVAVAGGDSHSVALKSDGSIIAWGLNDHGQADPPAGDDFVAIAGGGAHSLALKSDGSLIAWGDNQYNQSLVPVGNDFVATACGRNHSLALVGADGSLVAWGSNQEGQLDVPLGNDFVAVACGKHHSLALKTDGSLAGWGLNDHGQTDVPRDDSFTSIAGGWGHSVALVREDLAASEAIKIEVESPPGSGSFVVMEYTVVPTTSPRVRITFPDAIDLSDGEVRVLLSDTDPSTADTDLTEMFLRNQISPFSATATIPAFIDRNTITVTSVESVLGTGSMLSFNEETLVVSAGIRYDLVSNPDVDVEYEGHVIMLDFANDAPFDEPQAVPVTALRLASDTASGSALSINGFLRSENLRPLDVAVPLKLIRAEITTGEDPFELASRLSSADSPILDYVWPNLKTQLRDVAGEALPARLAGAYRSSAGAGCTGAGEDSRGCFDYTGPDATNRLRPFRFHFLMDTFAAHRLVDLLVPADPQTASLAIIDTGLGNYAADPCAVDPSARTVAGITCDRLFGLSTPWEPGPFNFDAQGHQIDGLGNRRSIDLTDIRDSAFPNDHGTGVVAAAAADGTAVLGTGRDALVRFMQLGYTNAQDAYMILAVSRDPRVSVLNTSWGSAGSAYRNQFLQFNLAGTLTDVVEAMRVNGKIWCVAADNAGVDDAGTSWPDSFAPGPGARGPDDPLVVRVNATGTAGTVGPSDTMRGPERLAEFANFGDRTSVAAPGEERVLPDPSGNLRPCSGCSYASPTVAGLATEMIYLDRNLRAAAADRIQPLQIIEIIEATADDLGSTQTASRTAKPNNKPGDGFDVVFGHGRINCWKAVLSTVNGGLADESHPIYGWLFRIGWFRSLDRVSETETKWYGFKVITSVLGATAWINGKQLLEADPILPNPFPGKGETQTASKQINAYAGVRSDQAILIGVDDDNDSVLRDDGDDDIRLDEDPTSGIVPVGNEGGEYVMTFSIERTDLIDEKGKPLTLSLRRPGQTAADAPFLNLRLDLEEMRTGSVPGVVFDDFVFEITPADFGDAPASYGTLLKDNGARHMNTNLEWLGKPGRPNQQSVSPEQDADSEVDQDGTPNILNGNPDLDRYDDGVVFFPLTYVPGKKGKVEFTVRVADADSGRYADLQTRSLCVNGWIDWNTDGRWEEANKEHVVDGVQIDPNDHWAIRAVRSGQTPSRSAFGDNYATYTAEFTVPDHGKGQLWARFRLDYGEDVGRNDPQPFFRSDPSLRDPVTGEPSYVRGAARFGEVEDYLIGSDFGDAPDPGTGKYPTRQSQPSDGARHLDIYKEWLGDSKTREPDACLEAGALSADEDTHHGAPPNLHLDCEGQDEDLAEEFVVFWNGFTRKLQVMFTVHSTISSRGYDLMGKDDDGDGLIDEDPFADEIDEDGDGKDGEDGPNVMSVLSLSPGTCSYQGFPVWSTPPWSGGKGRYQATRVNDDRDRWLLDEDNVGGGDADGDRLVDEDPSIVKPLFVNIYVDWNQDGDWDEPAEWVLKDALIAPETFGPDGKYTLGEPFEDRNHDGVWQSGEPFTDSAGNDSQTYACYFDAPITDLYTLLRLGPLGNALWVRIRLSYAETHCQITPNASLSEESRLGVIQGPQERSLFPSLSEELIQLGICHSTEDDRNLNKDRGGALAGEVEDRPIRFPYFSKAVGDSLISLGGDLTYTISLSNPNAYDILDIILFDPLPAGVSFISLIQAPPGIAFSLASNALEGRFDLGAFEDIQLSYTVSLTPQVAGGTTFANCVTIEGPGFTAETCSPVTTVCEPPQAVARCRPSYATRYPRGRCGCEVILREKALFDGQESSDPDGLIVSYSWNFGDGTTKEGATVQHIYKRKGTFTACLTVTDDDDVADTVCCQVKVVRPEEHEPDFPPGDTL
ncbi:MAG: PKD domain-containing protein [Candidatus Bipolaricaulia bacterium]